tara:strand:+ start:2833 stop:3441 length:609 start_codon:yes stop_codon:yes gene_type:complete
MSEVLNGPIPGQSLTTTPGNFPWEQPPETEQPEEALLWHISRMSDTDFMDGATTLMELEIPIESLTNTLLTNAVGEGIHTIDVGLIIAPSVHKELISLAKQAGIEYKEFFSEDAEREALEKTKLKALVLHKIKKLKGKDKPAIISETAEALGSSEVEEFEDKRGAMDQEPMSEEPMSEDVMPSAEPMDMPEEQGMGLMSRGA